MRPSHNTQDQSGPKSNVNKGTILELIINFKKAFTSRIHVEKKRLWICHNSINVQTCQ